VNPKITTIEFRFDLFCQSNSCHSNFTEYSMYDRCSNLSTVFNEHKPRCLSTNLICGLDNLMIGTFDQLFNLITYFHTKLSIVLAMYPNTTHQEFIVFQLIEKMFIAPLPQMTGAESDRNHILLKTVSRPKQIKIFNTNQKRF